MTDGDTHGFARVHVDTKSGRIVGDRKAQRFRRRNREPGGTGDEQRHPPTSVVLHS